MSGNSNRRLEISEIRASCDEPRKLRVVVSVKPNPPRDKVTQLREAKSELKTTELSVLIPPSSGVENGKLLVVQVYEIRRRWLDKQLLNEEFSFEALGTYCAGESEFKVYPILRQGDITIHANLKVTNVDDLLPSKSITGTILVSPVLPSAPVAASTISKVDCDSSVASNLSAALTLVQQVGDLMGSIPLMKPIAEILKQFVEVYKKVEDNYGKRDSLVEKVAVLARDIAGAMNLLNERGDVDWNTRLKSDLDEYMALLKEVRDSIIAFDDRRGPIRVLKREELGEAFDSLDQKITFFGNRFGNKRSVELQLGQGRIEDGINEMRDAGRQSKLQEEQKEIIDWLSPLNFLARRNEILVTRQEGTGIWLLDNPRFNKWKESVGDILWCRGMPGAGKTVLTSIVGKHLETSTENIAVAHIFLDHMDKTQTPCDLLASLSKQLVLRKVVLVEKMRKLYQDHSKLQTRPSLADITTLLASLVAGFPKVYIVIDALDEYPADDRLILLRHLTNLGNSVNLMLTSRDNVELHPELSPRVVDLKISASSQDIQSYVSEQIKGSTRLSMHIRDAPELRQEIILRIAALANGMFLLAKLHLASLATTTSVTGVRDALGSLSKDLNSVYKASMDRIHSQPDNDRKLALAVLSWVSNAKRPLTVEELREALAVKPKTRKLDPANRPNIHIILEVCVGLVVVTDKSETVRLVHSTTQDYLHPLFPEAHTDITRILLAYLSSEELGITLASDKAQASTDLEKTPLVEYCCYCLEHAAIKPEVLLSDIVAFLKRAHEWAPIWSRSGVRPWDMKHSSWPTSASPLWFAVAANLPMIAKYLLDNGATPDGEQFEYVSALGVAAYYGDIHMVQTLIGRGAICNPAGVNPLQLAALWGHTQIMQILLQNNADINATGGQYASPLEAAKQLRRADIVQLLCDKGAYARTTGYKALQIASAKGQTDMVHCLLNKGVKVDRDAILAAAEENHVETIRVLLNYDIADLNTVGQRYAPALQVAARWGHTATVRLLLDSGANMNGNSGAALKSAVRWGYTEIAQMLLEKDAEPSDDLVRIASQCRHADIVRLLLKMG